MTFNDFLSPLIPLFNSVTKNHGLDYADSQDVIQETTLSLWKKFSAGKIDLSKNTTAFALQLINWRAKDVCRAKKKFGEMFLCVTEENDLDTLPCPVAPQKPRFPAKILSYAKTRLKPRDYEIFIDHFIHGKPVNETAKRFNLDKSIVYLVRCRALKKVKNYKYE